MSKKQIATVVVGIFVLGLVSGLLVPRAKEQQKEVKEKVESEPAMVFTVAEDGTVSGIRRFEGVIKNPLKLDQLTLDSITDLAGKAVVGEEPITKDVPPTSPPTRTQSRMLLPLVIDDNGNVSGSWELKGMNVKGVEIPETDLVIEISITKDGKVVGTYEEKVSPKVSPVVDDGVEEDEELDWVPIPQKKPEPKPAVTHAPDPKPEPKTYSTHPEMMRVVVPRTRLYWNPNRPPPTQPNRFPGRYFKY